MIKIESKNELPKISLELFGFSTKRNRNDTMGQKGTGLKFIMALALRKNIKLIVSTPEYVAEIISEDIGNSGEGRIVIKYKTKGFYKFNETHKTSLTVNAGVDDWNDEWFILRELLQNAYDEDPETEPYFSDVLNSIKEYVSTETDVNPKDIDFADSGTTEYYLIGENIRLNEVVDNLENFFSGEAEGFNENGSWHKKSVKNERRIFVKGILVDVSTEESDFDYSFTKLELSESRTIRYYWDVENKIMVLNGSDEELSKISLDKMLKNPDVNLLDSERLIELYKEHYSGFKPIISHEEGYEESSNGEVFVSNRFYAILEDEDIVEPKELSTYEVREKIHEVSSEIKNIINEMLKKQKLDNKKSIKYIMAEEIFNLRNN